MAPTLWTKAFFLAALEKAGLTGLSTFAASLVVTSGTVTLHSLYAALIAGGMGALYQFITSMQATQVTNDLSKLAGQPMRIPQSAALPVPQGGPNPQFPALIPQQSVPFDQDG
jgi:hypothetical protein